MATREAEIVDETVRFIARHTMSDFSTKAIAENVGCSEALLFKYFRNKDLLIQRCIDHVAEWHIAKYHELFDEQVKGCLTETEIAEATFYVYLRMCGEYAELTMFMARLRTTKYSDILGDAMARIEEEHYQTFVDAVEKAGAGLELTDEYGRFIFDTAKNIVFEYSLCVMRGEEQADEETYRRWLRIVMGGMRALY